MSDEDLANEIGMPLKQEQLEACRDRVKDAWRIAQRLKQENLVKGEEDWTKDEALRQIASDFAEAESLVWPDLDKEMNEKCMENNVRMSYFDSLQYRNHPSMLLSSHLQGDILVNVGRKLDQKLKTV